jgi:two-component system response regulator AtoC
MRGLIGISAAIQGLRQESRLLSKSSVPVLISGERGTGKRLIAHLLHYEGDRRDGPLITIECGSVDDVELQTAFGRAAVPASSGEIQHADGTVVLRDVDRLSRKSQEFVFRSLERGIGRMGGALGTRLSRRFRVIATTVVDLGEKVETRQFRDDLYYRLNAAHLLIPPLRERPEDIAILGQTWLRVSSERRQVAAPELPSAVLKLLVAYDWPGNVTELQDVMDRLCAGFSGSVVTPEDLRLVLEKTSKGRR